MSSRTDLIERWQSQLAASESIADSAPDRLRWLHHMRVRLYRFLISCYGDGTWTADSANARDEPRAPFIDNTAGATGLVPKSAERIRATLKSVRNANDRNDSAGPLARGLSKSDWIRVAAFGLDSSPDDFFQLLESVAVPFRCRHMGGRYVVEVQRFDYDIAFDQFQEMRHSTVPHRRPKSSSRRLVSLVVASLMLGICLICALLVGLNSPTSPLPRVAALSLSIALGFTALSALMIALPLIPRVLSASEIETASEVDPSIANGEQND